MQCNAKDDEALPAPMSACPTGTQPTDLLASFGSQPHETNRAGARRRRRRLSVSPPEIASSLPFGCYWRDFINRFVLHARHVLRAVASGQEGGATSGRATIGGRGCARQRVDACRARRRSLPRRVGGGGRAAGPRAASDDARGQTPVLELLPPVRAALQPTAVGEGAMLQLMRALLGCCLLQFVHASWAPATCRRWFRNRDFILVSIFFKTRFVDQNLTFIFLILKPKYTKNRIGFRISVYTDNEKNHWFSLVIAGRESHPCSATTTTYSQLSIEVWIEIKIGRI